MSNRQPSVVLFFLLAAGDGMHATLLILPILMLLSLAPWLVLVIMARLCLLHLVLHLVRSADPAATTAMTNDA